MLVLAALAGALAVRWLSGARLDTLASDTPPTLRGMLRLQGISAGEAREALGDAAFDAALLRCSGCASGSWCRELVRAGMAAPLDCPNRVLIAALVRPRA